LASSSLSNQSDPFISSGDYNSAVKLLKKAQTVFVHEMGSRNQSEIDMLLLARIHRKMAFCYFHNHDYESSLKSITLTIRDNPNNPAHLRERAELYRLLGKQDLAGQDIAAAINLERSGGSSNMHAQFDWMQRPAFVEERK
jgi:Tfp pilus assembly protein PilF